MPKYADEYGISEIFDILKATYLPKSEAPQPSTGAPLADRTFGEVGISRRYAREDHVHPSDTSKAPINSPAFTGTPTAPTAAAGTNTQQVATTQFVQSALASSGFQEALTPGSHIRIQNGVISAYRIGDCDDVQINGNSIVGNGVANITDFVGCTEDDAGSAGLVPAPAVWENNCFLHASGQWLSPEAAGVGGVSYSETLQNTGKTWVDGRPIYQITFDLNKFEPVPMTTGYKQYIIDAIPFDIGAIIDVESVGYVLVDNSYIYTCIHGGYVWDYIGVQYYIGLSPDRNNLGIYQSAYNQTSYVYNMRYVTIKYIPPLYKVYEWNFKQSLTDIHYGITFTSDSMPTRDSNGVHLTSDTYLSLVNQGEDWQLIDGQMPTFQYWTLELDITSVTPLDYTHRYPTITNWNGSAQYSVLGEIYPETNWQFHVGTQLGGNHVDLGVPLSYFNGHTLKLRRHADKCLIYRDDTLIYTGSQQDIPTVMGNIISLGSIKAGTDDGISLPCTITRCKFMRDTGL